MANSSKLPSVWMICTSLKLISTKEMNIPINYLMSLFVGILLTFSSVISTIFGALVQDVSSPDFLDRATGPFAAVVILLMAVVLGSRWVKSYIEKQEERMIQLHEEMRKQLVASLESEQKDNESLRNEIQRLNTLLHKQ